MSRVLFFPLKSIVKYPDADELERLENLQCEIKSYRHRMLKDAKNKYESIVISQKLANWFTGLWEIVKD